MNEKDERPQVQPVQTRTMAKEELLARWAPGTQLTLVHSSAEGYVVKRRVVAQDNERRIVLSQAEGKKGHSEPAEIAFQEGDVITEEIGKQVAITIESPDGKSATYVEGFIA